MLGRGRRAGGGVLGARPVARTAAVAVRGARRRGIGAMNGAMMVGIAAIAAGIGADFAEQHGSG